MSAEATLRDRLGGLVGMSPGFPELVDVAVYGVRAGMLTLDAVPEVPALLPGDFAGWEVPYRELERLLLASGAWRAFHAERGEYPVEPVCPSWCSTVGHAAEPQEPPRAVIYHERELGAGSLFSVIAEQTQDGLSEPLISVDLPSGRENDRMTPAEARLYAQALLLAAALFDEVTR